MREAGERRLHEIASSLIVGFVDCPVLFRLLLLLSPGITAQLEDLVWPIERVQRYFRERGRREKLISVSTNFNEPTDQANGAVGERNSTLKVAN